MSSDGRSNRFQSVYAYSPYGESISLGPDEGNPLQYTGRENDGTGLYYYRARYYDPVLKRFMSEDPIGLRGGLNSRSFVGGNPISRTDPLGLMGFAGGGAAGGGKSSGGGQQTYKECRIRCQAKFIPVCWGAGAIGGLAAGAAAGPATVGTMSIPSAYIFAPVINASCQAGPVAEYCDRVCTEQMEPQSCPVPLPPMDPNADPGDVEMYY